MDIQLFIIALIFVAAVAYMVRMVFKKLFVKKGCGTNCKCSVDFSDAGPLKQPN